MSLIKRTLNQLKDRADNILNGGINSIPSPFERFTEDLLGIEQATYYLVTASTKGGKSQFSSYFFIFNPILYAYENKDTNIKIFYFNLEETPERITQRFMSYLLYLKSNRRIRISPKHLRSSDNKRPLDKDILNILESKEYQDILNFFEDHIIFSSTSNATGIFKECENFAKENGIIEYDVIDTSDEFGRPIQINKFKSYTPNDPSLYKIVFIDHISLISEEKGQSLKQSMDLLSKYLSKNLRNKYGFSPVVIQQQSTETENITAVRSNKIRPTTSGLSDTKYTARDANVVLGLFSPIMYEKDEYKKYDITIFRDNIRFLEVLRSRDGESGGLCPLYFDGAVSFFKELPKPEDSARLELVYKVIEENNSNN